MSKSKTRFLTSIYLQGLMYIILGANHFWHPEPYMEIMPDWLSFHSEMVFVSGVFEVLLGVGVLFKSSRRIAGWGLIALLIAVFPANIEMAKDFYLNQNPNLWIAIVRLPIQIILIWWAYDIVRISKWAQVKKG